MADYTKMKNAELENLLKERSLPHTGKKAELIKRLQDSDASGTRPDAPKVEDEIDWDDEPAAANATSAPAAAALNAGGLKRVANPQAVPNQVADIDPAQTSDLKVEADPAPAETTQDQTASAPASTENAKPEAAPAVDFSSGMKTTTIDEEIAKRKARAKKFGTDEANDETLKELERLKRFGATDMSGALNSALPERREKKRAREPEDAGSGQANNNKKGRPALGGREGSGRPPNRERSSTPRNQTTGASSSLSEADRQKAEARKARFAQTSTS